MIADLHIHSQVSDGSFSAEDILAQAQAVGLTHVAFTDHDTTENAQTHKSLAESYGLVAVTGVEMSAYDYERHRKVHILGYGYSETAHIEAIGADTLAQASQQLPETNRSLKRAGLQSAGGRGGQTGWPHHLQAAYSRLSAAERTE